MFVGPGTAPNETTEIFPLAHRAAKQAKLYIIPCLSTAHSIYIILLFSDNVWVLLCFKIRQATTYIGLGLGCATILFQTQGDCFRMSCGSSSLNHNMSE